MVWSSRKKVTIVLVVIVIALLSTVRLSTYGQSVQFDIEGNPAPSGIAAERLTSYPLTKVETLSIGTNGSAEIAGGYFVAFPKSVVPNGSLPSVVVNGYAVPHLSLTQDNSNYYVRFVTSGNPTKGEAAGTGYYNIAVVQFLPQSNDPLFYTSVLMVGLSMIIAVGLTISHGRRMASMGASREWPWTRIPPLVIFGSLISASTVLLPSAYLSPTHVVYALLLGLGVLLFIPLGATFTASVAGLLLAALYPSDFFFAFPVWLLYGALTDALVFWVRQFGESGELKPLSFVLAMIISGGTITFIDYLMVAGVGIIPADPTVLLSLHCPSVSLHCHPIEASLSIFGGVVGGSAATVFWRILRIRKRFLTPG
ncbi:MAG: hypothetical protein LYZ66_02150 [Nitrososphaerales archaeon]|nr:hypothetical protein [Nitrososphaerales archaeon]